MPPARKNKAVVNGVKKGKKVEETRSSPPPEDDTGAGEDSPGGDDSSPAQKKAKKRPAARTKKETKPAADRGDRRAVKAPERYVAPNLAAPTPAKKARGGGGGQYPVGAIRGIRQTGKKLEFLVKWDGYPEGSNNWEPESNVRTCSEHIKKFLDVVSRVTGSFE